MVHSLPDDAGRQWSRRLSSFACKQALDAIQERLIEGNLSAGARRSRRFSVQPAAGTDCSNTAAPRTLKRTEVRAPIGPSRPDRVDAAGEHRVTPYEESAKTA